MVKGLWKIGRDIYIRIVFVPKFEIKVSLAISSWCYIRDSELSMTLLPIVILNKKS